MEKKNRAGEYLDESWFSFLVIFYEISSLFSLSVLFFCLFVALFSLVFLSVYLIIQSKYRETVENGDGDD